MKKIWIVTMHHICESEDVCMIVGVFDNFDQAKDLVDDLYDEQEDIYDNNYCGEYNAENHNNGYAELHYPDGWDDTIIVANDYELNAETHEEI